jgi:hypothetical protein
MRTIDSTAPTSSANVAGSPPSAITGAASSVHRKFVIPSTRSPGFITRPAPRTTLRA